MRMLNLALKSILTYAAITLTSPVGMSLRSGCPSDSRDAPFSLTCEDLMSTVNFPDDFFGRAGGVVFLVHGTGSTGPETWGTGPYHSLLPKEGPGYDIAWFTSPTRSLEDAQVTSEYIAYNIKALAQRSKTGKVFLVGHSQGNVNIQWALAFYPSIRSYVSGFSSLAGDFHGTAEGPLLCTGQDLLQGGCEPSVLQQSIDSHYLAALNNAGGTALVGTTSIYTVLDDVIQPEILTPTSRLDGSSVVPVQQACPFYVVDHFGMPVAAPGYFLTLDAIAHGGVASLSRFNAITMCDFMSRTGRPNPYATTAAVIRQATLDAIAVVAFPKVVSEPKLKAYICLKGATSGYCS